MTSLREKLTRLANDRPDLRVHLDPLLRKASVPLDPTMTPMGLMGRYFERACQIAFGLSGEATPMKYGIFRYSDVTPGSDYHEISIQIAAGNVIVSLVDIDTVVVQTYKVPLRQVMSTSVRDFALHMKRVLKI
jgi:hypothetical protein